MALVAKILTGKMFTCQFHSLKNNPQKELPAAFPRVTIAQMISVICELDGTHAVAVWNDLFHGEQVERIPLILRWSQPDAGSEELRQWQYAAMNVDAHTVIDPPSKIHALVCEYSADQGETWSAVRFAKIHTVLPFIKITLKDVPCITDDLTLVFATAHGPVSLHTDNRLPIAPGAQFTLPMKMAPLMTFFLHPDLWQKISARPSFDFELISAPVFSAIDGPNIVLRRYAPATFAAHVVQDAVDLSTSS
jgi:hypothetical protein